MAPVEPDAHTLYSPSKKYFNRNDSSFSEAHGHASFSSVAGSSPGLCWLETPESIARERSRPPPRRRRPFVDPTCSEIQFYRISRNFGRTVSFGLSPLSSAPALFLASFFFHGPWNYAPAGFASFRGISPAQRGLAGRRYSFTVYVYGIYGASQISISLGSKSRDYTRRQADNSDENAGQHLPDDTMR